MSVCVIDERRTRAPEPTSVRPRLAGPIPPRRPLSFFKYLRVSRDNFIAGLHEGAFSESVYERKFLWFRSFIINDPDGIKRVLLDNSSNYVKADILQPVLGPALGVGLVTSDGETWRGLRKLISPVFDPRSVEGYAPVISAATADLLKRWSTLPDRAVVDIHKVMSALTLEIISRAVFASDSSEMVDIIERSSAEYQAKMTFSFWGVVPILNRLWARYKVRQGRHIVRKLDEAIYRLIARRLSDPCKKGHSDLLGRLIAARDSETGAALSSRGVRDQVVTIMMAGHETTASALGWIWYLLSQHPAEERKLHREVDEVLKGRAPTFEDIPNLPYTRMVIQEGMRLYPPVHTLSWRQATADDDVCGRRIPKGSIVWVVPWALHRNPTLWENPERFDPMRFSPERNASRSRFAYLPFSTGPRVCVGATLAMTEAVLIVATMAQAYCLRLAGEAPEPQGLVTLRSRHGMRMSLERR
ncbi:MAG TPA: cytochrome P450 [Stellaceae bacterium]|nr:cytochrome P450 [Stellaceae bacterium]